MSYDEQQVEDEARKECKAKGLDPDQMMFHCVGNGVALQSFPQWKVLRDRLPLKQSPFDGTTLTDSTTNLGITTGLGGSILSSTTLGTNALTKCTSESWPSAFTNSGSFDFYPKGTPSGYTAIKAPVYVGYLCITPSWKIAQLVKPAQKHLDNMRYTFGWTWEDAPVDASKAGKE